MSESLPLVEIDPAGAYAGTLSHLAASILTKSLKTVPRALKRAAKKWEKDDEYVHQLRVSGRRALTAVRLFAPLIPDSQAAWFKKQLKAILSVAGEARDLDVLMKEQLPRCGNAANQIGSAWMAERKKSQVSILKLYRKLTRNSRFRRHTQSLMKTFEDVPHSTTAENLPSTHDWIRDRLSDTSGRFFQSLSEAKDIPSLHRLRIDAKRLRYTIDLLKPALQESPVHNLKACLASLQEQLGSLQDHATALKHLKCARRIFQKSRTQKILCKLIDAENEAIANCRSSFRLWSESAVPMELRNDMEKCLQS